MVKEVNRKPVKHVTFDDFLKTTMFFLKTVGSEPYLHNLKRSKWKTVLWKIYYVLGLGQLDYLMYGEMVVFKATISDPKKFMLATAMAPCILFIVGVNVKEFALYIFRHDIYDVMQELRSIFPDNHEDQVKLKVYSYYSRIQFISYAFIFFCVAFTSAFNIFPIYAGVITVFFENGTYVKDFGYFVWYPFDTEAWDVYLILYGLQIHGAYLAGVLFVGADLMMCAAVAQNCMHFSHMKNLLLEYQPKGNEKDLTFITDLAKYHDKILVLNEKVNSMFSVCILVSFMTATAAICFIGFQITSSTPQDAIKFGLFLGAEITQLVAICYYGNKIVDSSTGVGDAMYYHNWYSADIRYRKMMIQIMQRSQRPASIRAPTFPPTSYETFMRIMTTSYKFFAVLRQSLNRNL
ncbi:GPROR8.2 family protein [Megaselia abdita]